MYLPLLSIRPGCIGFGLHLHRRMVGIKIVQLTYDYSSTANSKRKYNLLTVKQLVLHHLNAFLACLEGRLQLFVLRCIRLACAVFHLRLIHPYTVQLVHLRLPLQLQLFHQSLPSSPLKPLPQTAIFFYITCCSFNTFFSLIFCGKNNVQKFFLIFLWQE